MNNNYLRFLIKSGIRALTGAAVLAAAALILKSDDNGNKTSTQNSEKEAPKPEKAPEAAKASPQADTSKQPKPVHIENSEEPENSSYQAEWDLWKRKCSRFTDRPPAKRQNVYIPECLGEPDPLKIPQISLTEKQAEAFGYSFRKKSKRIRITNYHGSEKSIIIPAYIGGMLVNEIGANAFTNSCVERVAIPDNIKKLGESAFAGSNVQFVIFGKGLRAIPKMCFYNCKKLDTIVLPPQTEKLGEKAFYRCRSLKYIELPNELWEIGEDCFCESGLEGFAARFRHNSFDGSVFANTPLHRNNGLILYQSYNPSRETEDMKVLLVGNNVKINFKESRVRLGRNSVCAPCRLDFSQCKYLFTYRAFKYVPNYFGSKVHVIVSENVNPNSFPDFVDVRCPNGEYTGWYEKLEEDHSQCSLKLKVNSDLCTHSLKNISCIYRTKNLTLISDKRYKITIDNHAVCSGALDTLELVGRFEAGWDSCIFDPRCFGLHKIKWESIIMRWDDELKNEYVQFIPSGYAVRGDVHRALLKAFRRVGFDGFFDPKVIENVFENGVIRELSKTRMPLSRREKILIAIDVLKSSPELYPDGTERYSQFLRRHIDYARNMCQRLPREVSGYLGFLDKFAPME